MNSTRTWKRMNTVITLNCEIIMKYFVCSWKEEEPLTLNNVNEGLGEIPFFSEGKSLKVLGFSRFTHQLALGYIQWIHDLTSPFVDWSQERKDASSRFLVFTYLKGHFFSSPLISCQDYNHYCIIITIVQSFNSIQFSVQLEVVKVTFRKWVIVV